MAYDSANRLVQRNAVNLSYDANGNLTSDGDRSFVWDARRNRLEAVASSNSQANYRYDPLGRRTEKSLNGTIAQYIYAGDTPIREVVDGESAILINGLGVDEYIRRVDPLGVHVLITDAFGSIIAVIRADGTVEQEYIYDPFGRGSDDDDFRLNQFQFTGRENDGGGLYYFRNRYHATDLMRFISEDPIGFAGGDLNIYAYLSNNPLDGMDLLGLGKTQPEQ